MSPPGLSTGEHLEDGIQLQRYSRGRKREENEEESCGDVSDLDEGQIEQGRLLFSPTHQEDEEQTTVPDSVHDSFANDPFQPLSTKKPPGGEEERILTFRALLVGVLCGTLVNASNIYLGLRAGWTASANIFGSIIGFAVLKSWSSNFAPSSVLGGFFGPQENNIVQTAATAAGGMSSVFVSAFPAMYQLGLLDTPWKDFIRMTTLTAAGGYFGLFFATPLRRFFIFQVARELNLVFPSSSATAITISSMHLAAGGSQLARRKMMALSFAFVFALVLRIISQYALGILWDWHIFTWLALLGVLPSTMFSIESWGWFFEWTPAFIGTGMLVGMNVALSFVFGSILAWGIVGPVITRHGLAFGTPASEDSKWDGLMVYSSFTKEFANATHPSPRYWLLWPGVACMIVVGFTELACQWRVFWLTGLEIYKGIRKYILWLRTKENSYISISRGEAEIKEPQTGQIKQWMWLPGLICVLVLTCLISNVQYGIPVSASLLSLFLAFIFSFIAVQATGATDITPLTAISKASQLVLGATTRGPEWSLDRSQRVNLLGGALSSIGANQACDLTGDFRVGFLLRTPPRTQYAAQAIGTFFAVFLAPAVFSVFTSAYPCILSTDSEYHSNKNTTAPCPFTAPAASAWRAAAVAVTDPDFPIPRSSIQFSVVMAIVGCLLVLVRHNLWTKEWLWMRDYHPNMMTVAMAFLIPTTQYGTAMLTGTVIALIWKKKNSASFEAYGYAVAAGCMAGEGIGGVVNAALTIMGVDGERFGTILGCPGGRC